MLVRLGSSNVGLRNPLLPYFRVYVAPAALLRHAFEHFHIPVALANEAKALARCAAWLHAQVARVDAAVAALPALPEASPEIVLPTSRRRTAEGYRAQLRQALAVQLAAVRIALLVCAARQRGDARASSLPSVVALVARSFAGQVSFLFIYRYISRESCSQFDSLPRTSLTIVRGSARRRRDRGRRRHPPRRRAARRARRR